MPDPATEARRRRPRDRDRNRGSGRQRGPSMQALLQARWFGRALNITVALAAVAYGAYVVDAFRRDTNMLGFRPLYAPRSEVVYGFGRPAQVGNAGGAWQPVAAATPLDGFDRWAYPSEGGGTYTFRFDASGAVSQVSCYQADASRGACPGLYGVQLGDSEEALAARLGNPPVRRLIGTSAILRYPSIGAEFELRQFKVHRITIDDDKSSLFGRIGRFIRFAIP